jgi:hypothetical protein
MDSTAKAAFTNITVSRKPNFFDEAAGFRIGGKPTVMLQFTGLAEANGRRDYFIFRLWGAKARTYVGRLKTGVRFRCKATPRSVKMRVYGKSGRPLRTATREIRMTWKTVFHINEMDILS